MIDRHTRSEVNTVMAAVAAAAAMRKGPAAASVPAVRACTVPIAKTKKLAK